MSAMEEQISTASAPESRPHKGRGHSSNLVLKMIMQGKDIGSIIGKEGATVKQFRDESNAHINISDGSTPERIVSVTGTRDAVVKAFALIGQKLEEELKSNSKSSTTPPVTLRLIVPGSQCGSIIGKGGAKIKEIREVSGASVVVAGEFLPGSSERAVTLSGTPDALATCIDHLCAVMIEFPPRGHPMPYTPHKQQQPYGYYGPPQPFGYPGQYGGMPPFFNNANGYLQRGPYSQGGRRGKGGGPPPQGPVTNHTMTIMKGAVGSIIGQKGSYITSIRQMSGAGIKIGDSESGDDKRDVHITGTAEAVGLAQFLINARLRQDGKSPVSEDHENTDASENGAAE